MGRRVDIRLLLVAMIAATCASCAKTVEECREESDEAQAHIEAVRQAHLSCTDHTDCAQVSLSTDCYGACPSVVNTAGVAAVQEAVSHANGEWCTDRTDCGFAQPGCIAVSPACTQGSCTNGN